MLLPSGRSILSLDGLHQWSADLSWWVQTKAIRRTYCLGANQSSYHYGLVYSTRLGNLRGRISRICDSPPLPPTYVLLASIALLCFIEYTLKADTPDIWPKLLQPPAMGFFTVFPDKYPDTTLVVLLMYKTIWTCACRFWQHFEYIFFGICTSTGLIGFCGFGPKDPHFQKLGLKWPEFNIFEIFFWIYS